jgi:Sortase domain
MRLLGVLLVVGLLSASGSASCGGPTPAGPPAKLGGLSRIKLEIPRASPSPSPPQPGIPIRLLIPALGIDSPTMAVGLMPDGSVGTPCDPKKPAAPCNTNASAWYQGSVRPGEPGDAVLDSHVDWYGPAGSNHDIPALFAHLDRLKPGDLVEVVDAGGTVRSFSVTQVWRLPYPQQPPDTYAQDGPPRLTLITCVGVYVSPQVGMNQRLYVRALQVDA